MEYLKLNAWGREFNLCIEVEKYVMNNNLALQLYDNEDGFWEPFATLTVNLDEKCDVENAFVDTCDAMWAEDLIKQYHLGEPTGKIRSSGYWNYPEYKFNMNEIEKYRLDSCEIAPPKREIEER